MHLCSSAFSYDIYTACRFVATSVWHIPSISNPGCCSRRTDVKCIMIFQMFHHHYSDSGCPEEIWSCSEFKDSWNVDPGKLISAQLAATFLYIMGLTRVTLIRYKLIHYLFKIHFNISHTWLSFKVFKLKYIHPSSSQRVRYVVYFSAMRSKNWGDF